MKRPAMNQYNSSNKFNANEQAFIGQQQQQQQHQLANRVEYLCGKVIPNRFSNNSRPNPSLEERMAAINQQYKTLPSRGLNQPISKFLPVK